MNDTRALVVLTPYESRRLLAKYVCGMPAVRRALADGWVIVATGSTTAYVAEEILGTPLVKENFISGHITGGETWSTPDNPDYIYPIVLHKGQRDRIFPEEALKQFRPGDVFIKGANAVDAAGHAAVFMGNDMGGTIGGSLGALSARGSHLIVPVGLEKLVPDVIAAARHSGNMTYKYCMGTPVGLMPLVNATVVTELQALAGLYGVTAYHLGGGGIAGTEGAVVLTLAGEERAVARAYEGVQALKGEPSLGRPHGTPKH